MLGVAQFVIICTLWSLSNAGFVPPAELCLPSSHLKELSGCVAMTDKEDECSAKETEDEKLDCYCTQEMLSSIFSCQNDVRRCLESHMFDSQFEYRVRRWHSTCDSRFPSTTLLTTPPVTSLTATYDFYACNRLYQSCASADYETNKCSQTWMPTSSLSYISCACQPPVYSLFSECQYNGNISCKRTTAAETNIMGYSICSYFWSGSETLSSIDLTSMLSEVKHELTAYTPAAHVTSVAALIRSTLPLSEAQARQTPLGRQEAQEYMELK